MLRICVRQVKILLTFYSQLIHTKEGFSVKCSALTKTSFVTGLLGSLKLRAFWDFHRQTAADFASKMAVDFVVAWNGFPMAGLGIYPDRMRGTFSEKLTAVFDGMALQLAPLHDTISSICSALGSFARASSRFNSNKSRTAAVRLSRHSLRVSPCPLAPGTSKHVAQNPPSSGSPRWRIAVNFFIR